MAIGSVNNQMANVQDFAQASKNRQVEQTNQQQIEAEKNQEEENRVRKEEDQQNTVKKTEENTNAQNEQEKKSPVGNMLNITA